MAAPAAHARSWLMLSDYRPARTCASDRGVPDRVKSLVMLELVHTIVDRDDALAFLLSGVRCPWRFDQSFGRWTTSSSDALCVYQAPTSAPTYRTTVPQPACE